MTGKEVEVEVEEEEPLVTRKEGLEHVKKIATDNNKGLASEIATRLMSDMEERLEITEEWVEQVTEMLDLAGKVTYPRVATALMNVNPVAYIPQFISLGPYHHWKLKEDVASSARGTYQSRSLKISAVEEYKIMYVAKKLRKDRQSFNSIVEKIEGERLEIERFYDWKIEEGQSSKNFAFMMTVDSSFLLCFLFGLFRDQSQSSGSRNGRARPAAAPSGPDQPQTAGAPSRGSQPSDDGIINLSAFEVYIKHDILKLENQIPLFVLQHVFEMGKDVLAEAEHEADFSYLLKKTYPVFSPFDATTIDSLDTDQINDAVAKKTHLLDCMQAFVSPFLEMTTDVKDNRPDQPLFQRVKRSLSDCVEIGCRIFISHLMTSVRRGDFVPAVSYNAEQLHKIGINFKSFSDPKEHIRFDTYSETLYLPRITLLFNIYTEVFLRNMIALEFNDPERRNSVTRYVGLMDCLIDTPNDVRLLRDSDIIRKPSLTLTDEYVAKMWDGMCQPFFTAHVELPEEFELKFREVLVKKYYTNIVKSWLWELSGRIKIWLRELHREYLSTPWKVIALLVGFCILAITVIQGYCSFVECKGKFGTGDRNNSTRPGDHGT